MLSTGKSLPSRVLTGSRKGWGLSWKTNHQWTTTGCFVLQAFTDWQMGSTKNSTISDISISLTKWRILIKSMTLQWSIWRKLIQKYTHTDEWSLKCHLSTRMPLKVPRFFRHITSTIMVSDKIALHFSLSPIKYLLWFVEVEGNDFIQLYQRKSRSRSKRNTGSLFARWSTKSEGWGKTASTNIRSKSQQVNTDTDFYAKLNSKITSNT